MTGPSRRYRAEDIEQVPGRSRLRLHARVAAGADHSTALAEVRRTLEIVAKQLEAQLSRMPLPAHILE